MSKPKPVNWDNEDEQNEIGYDDAGDSTYPDETFGVMFDE